MRETLATILWEGWTALVLCAAAVFLPGSDVRCIPTEQILLSQLSSVFSTYTVEEATAFCVTRNADINPEDEAFDFDDDFRALAEQPAPLPPEQLLEKQKPPYRVPDTEVLFVSRSLDLS